jgi:hypothetical protein
MKTWPLLSRKVLMDVAMIDPGSLEMTDRGKELREPDEVVAMVRLNSLGWGVRRIAPELGCGHMMVRLRVFGGQAAACQVHLRQCPAAKDVAARIGITGHRNGPQMRTARNIRKTFGHASRSLASYGRVQCNGQTVAR